MFIDAKPLIAKAKESLAKKIENLGVTPELSIIWVGEDNETRKFVEVKKKLGKELLCEVTIHHLAHAEMDQMIALIECLNSKKSVQGIVLQLPLPKNLDTNYLISLIKPQKDIDNLTGTNTYPSPNPQAILDILADNKIDLKKQKPVILGYGRLVGRPLSAMLTKQNIEFDLVKKDAATQAEFIKKHDVLIAATGRDFLVKDSMVHKDTVVIDASGIDVDAVSLEKEVKLITPTKGAIGPLTVLNLFGNLIRACG